MPSIIDASTKAYFESGVPGLLANETRPYLVEIWDPRHAEFLDSIMMNYRQRGLYVIPSKKRGAPRDHWSGSLYIPKTELNYHAMILDRNPKSTAQDIKFVIPEFDQLISIHYRVIGITKRMLSDRDAQAYYIKGKEMEVNWNQVFSRNKFNRGWGQHHFEFNADLRNYISTLYDYASLGLGIRRASKELLISNVCNYSTVSGVTNLKYLEVFLASLDTLNMSLTTMIANSPVKTNDFDDFVNGYKDSRDFRPNFEAHWDPNLVSHYFDVFTVNGVARGIFFR